MLLRLLLSVYILSVAAAGYSVLDARLSCNGVGECSTCTWSRRLSACMRAFAVPFAMVAGVPILIDAADELGLSRWTVATRLSRLWSTICVLAVRHACCDASTGNRVAFVDYVLRHLRVPSVARAVLKGDDL